MMTLSDQGRQFLIRMVDGVKRFSCRLDHCTSVQMIGIGHTLTRQERMDGAIRLGDQRIYYVTGLTRGEVEELFDQDLRPVEIEVNEVPGLNQHHYDALVSFCFSIGPRQFANSTVKRRLLQHDCDSVPDLMKAWVHEYGVTVYALIQRRQAEAKLFVEGDYRHPPKDWIEDPEAETA